jgi:excisionase family DNA binding protein
MNDRMTFTAKETAKVLGIGMNKVYELLISKKIPSKRYGRKYLISKCMLEKCINEDNVKV